VVLEVSVFRPLLHESHGFIEFVRGLFLLDAFATGAGNFYAPVSWAIAVEVVFYIFAVLLYGRGKPALALVMVLAGVSTWALLTGFNVIGFGRLLQRGLLGFPLGIFAYAIHRRVRAFDPGPIVLSLAELALLGFFAWIMWLPGKTAGWIPGMDLLFTAMVLVFARDGGIASRVLQLRWLVKLGQLSFAIYMVHLYYVILPNRFLPQIFRALGHADWVAPGRHTFGLLSVAPPPAVATGITIILLALVLPTAWLAWRFIEEPAREWSKRWAESRKAAPGTAAAPAA
jgi:peptidoglycan/LPS O-acetylase OafA/YrhL